MVNWVFHYPYESGTALLMMDGWTVHWLYSWQMDVADALGAGLLADDIGMH